jgi:hypothetical protein
MLHFCAVKELSDAIAVAGRYQNDLRGVRDQVTQKLNDFMRRTLDYQAGVVEYFDTLDLSYNQSVNLWTYKKPIANVIIGYSLARAWDDNILTDDRFIVDGEEGKITLYGYTRRAGRGLRVVYDGGYPPREDDPEVMDCPYNLKYAAIQQGIFDARRALGMDQGTATDDDKKTPVRLRYNGLLEDTAAAFMKYRRTLGQ